MTTMLSDAIELEREAMLENSMSKLRGEGYDRFSVHELPGYDEPPPLTIPVLNVQMRPDVYATHGRLPPSLAVVEPSTDLGEEACGRRWQALQAWAEAHAARLHVYVHPEDEARAQAIAAHWHLDTHLIEPLSRAH